MKTMKNFAAQRLTEKQMSEVKGGGTYAIYAEGQLVCWVKADSLSDADAWAKDTYGGGAHAERWNG